MDRNFLITFASRYGATKEIAERIAEVFRQAELQTDVYPVDGIRDLKLYKAVILGSAVYMGKWRKEAVEFLQIHEKSLAHRPVWLFSSGPTGDGDPVELVGRKRLPAVLQPIADRIHPCDIAVFHGFINPDKINFIEKWAIKSLVKKPFGDFRDWDSIDSWARSIADTLTAKGAEQSSVRY